MKTIGLAVNHSKVKADEITARLIELIEKYGSRLVLDEESAAKADRADLALPLDRFAEEAELLFVLGGDGTMLGFARQFARAGLPILGINIGHLGFLSEAEPKDLENAVKRVLDGEYCLENRLMLEARVVRNGETVMESLTALNDIGIARDSFGKMVTCKVFVDDMYVDQYTGDGLLISTPTGSTAYSLSCGGPIVSPHIEVILLTPICAHTLHARPMVIAANQEVRVEVSASHPELVLSLDGQIFEKLEQNDVVHVRQAPYKTTLIKWHDREFYDVLRQKLHRAP
ncbi:NAD(+)/NADH kinase [Tumebacillus sp. DT12]|uniref:NAD kinase n=1 Tax=Tumebacillus lacus TaxID=2995335 RepID=A0ABT3X9U4_9BACL|nr:NAD(+)/NADH kinase [Tumebacillus lacus]MCX7571519.1 NAD(+)/NADH kinase [Tumebacillus lacus]